MSDPQSKTYTPVEVIVSNLDTLTIHEFRSVQGGDCLTVDGTVACALTVPGTDFIFDLTLPVSTQYGSQYQICGSLVAEDGITGVGFSPGPGGLIRFTCNSPAGSASSFSAAVHFSYRLQGP